MSWIPEPRRTGFDATSGPERRLSERIWHVSVDGGAAVGPVSADQIARGIRAGKVPSHARVKRETDIFWTDAIDVVEVVAALKAVTAESETPSASKVTARQPAVREYLVWIEGGDPVGPVSAQQIARGIRAGKVPADARLQPVDDMFAHDVLDEPEVVAALKML
jgi:hypothetical protein